MQAALGEGQLFSPAPLLPGLGSTWQPHRGTGTRNRQTALNRGFALTPPVFLVFFFFNFFGCTLRHVQS